MNKYKLTLLIDYEVLRGLIDLAEKETNGNLSKLCRILLKEALERRKLCQSVVPSFKGASEGRKEQCQSG